MDGQLYGLLLIQKKKKKNLFRFIVAELDGLYQMNIEDILELRLIIMDTFGIILWMRDILNNKKESRDSFFYFSQK